jgi:hypothetical protein
MKVFVTYRTMFTSSFLCRPVACVLLAAALLSLAARAGAQDAQDAASVDLVLKSGRSMRVALDHRVAIHKVGQPVAGTLVEPVYVYDRIVLPVGCHLTGHIERIDDPSKKKRTVAILNGDFSPHPVATLRFDSIVDPDGRTIRIDTVVKGGTLRARPHTAKKSKEDGDGEEKTGKVEQAKEAVSAQAHDALAMLKDPGKKERLEEFGISKLPYHSEYLAKGMVYDVQLVEPVNFGSVPAVATAPPGSLPAPDSVLEAKFETPIDSAKTPRGAPITAVLTQPVFSANHKLILPEGATLTGEVTLAKQARRWHRNGQLRVLFESVQSSTLASSPLRGSLYSVDAASGSGVTVDEEGGATIANSKKRFVAPALAVLALRGTTHHEDHLDADPGEPVQVVKTQGSPGAKAIGGLFGFGGIGAVAAQFYHPLAIGLSAVGAARTLYKNVYSKGSEMTFNADTPIEVRLAPGAANKNKSGAPNKNK